MSGKIHYSQTLRALVRRVCGEDLPTDMDEATQKNLPMSLQAIQPHLSDYSTSQLFAAKFVQLWVRSVYARRKAMTGDHHGVVKLTVLGAKHLKDLDAFGKQDPYVAFWVEPEVVRDYVHIARKPRGRSKASVGPQHAYTDTRYKGGTDCYWSGGVGERNCVELRLDAPVVGPGASIVWAEAWDEDLASADDLIGMSTIPIFAALVKGDDTVTVPLADQAGVGGCGELKVRVQWIPDSPRERAALRGRRASLEGELSDVGIQRLQAAAEEFSEELAAERRHSSFADDGVDAVVAPAGSMRDTRRSPGGPVSVRTSGGGGSSGAGASPSLGGDGSDRGGDAL